MSTDPWLGDIAETVNAGGRPAKDHSGRQRKLACPRCTFTCYATTRAIRLGMPRCACGAVLELPNLRDRMAVDEEGTLRALERQGVHAYESAMRELGYRGELVKRGADGRISADRRSGDGMARCQWSGGYCVRFTAGKYCHEHERMAA